MRDEQNGAWRPKLGNNPVAEGTQRIQTELPRTIRAWALASAAVGSGALLACNMGANASKLGFCVCMGVAPFISAKAQRRHGSFLSQMLVSQLPKNAQTAAMLVGQLPKNARTAAMHEQRCEPNEPMPIN